MATYHIHKVAVLGAGLMGSALACHMAGCGFQVLLLDLPSQDGTRNDYVERALKKCIASQPSPLYKASFVNRIETGNFEDDMHRISDCDWILEAVVEQLPEKRKLYKQIENYMGPHTLITSNTSGIPIQELIEDRSEHFRSHFCGTHFFNPPRYLPLLEIIPSSQTLPEVIRFFMEFGQDFLGKQTVLCKDTPGFIANRIGVTCLMQAFELAEALHLTIAEVDTLTGTALGRPKTATFRLADLVGLDTATFVFRDLKQRCPDDPILYKLGLPRPLEFLFSNKHYGNKSSKGFYFKTESPNEKARPRILQLDLHTLEYVDAQKSALESCTLSRQIEDLEFRLKTLVALEDAGAQFLRKSLGFLFAYSSSSIPEISDSIHAIDEAMRSGFGWEKGPFELWDILGFEQGLAFISESGETPAEWLLKMKSLGRNSFYRIAPDCVEVIYTDTLEYHNLKAQELRFRFHIPEQQHLVYKNEELRLHDIGDGVLCAEFISPHNAIGEGILRGLEESIHIAEQSGYKGLVIGNTSKNFTVGANLMLIGMMAFQSDYEQLEKAVRLFQQTSMRCRYSSIPVVLSAQGYCFGGGTELLLHCDGAVCTAESYIGFVEVGIGVLPGGGGTKEFARRLSLERPEVEIENSILLERFKTIATAGISRSAFEAFDLGYLSKDRDQVVIPGNPPIQKAKERVLELSKRYIKPNPHLGIKVIGQSGLALLYAAANSMKRAGYASDHDVCIARKIAHVLCGGELSYPQFVTEEYLLDLEREAFLSLCTEPKTLERIQFMLENNKPLRN